VAWPSLGALLDSVAKVERLPEGRTIAVGHSGAYRTLAVWVDEPRLDTITLIDAAYGDLRVFASWLEERPDRRLIDIGDQMSRVHTDAFHELLGETFTIYGFPAKRIPDEARRARVLYIRSNVGHMRLVTGGIAIPVILRALVAPLVAPEP
jgi:hypothetical protein